MPGSLQVISNTVEKVLQIINNTVSLGVGVLATPKIKLQESFSRRLITLTNSLRVKFWTTHKTKRHTQITSTRRHHSLMGGLLPETQQPCQIRGGGVAGLQAQACTRLQRSNQPLLRKLPKMKPSCYLTFRKIKDNNLISPASQFGPQGTLGPSQ